MELAPRSFTETANALDKALVEIKEKKDVFDLATKAVNEASAEYQRSIESAQFLRNELNKSLNSLMGDSTPGRVRQSA